MIIKRLIMRILIS